MSLTLETIPPVGCFGNEWIAQVERRFLYILCYNGSFHTLFEQALCHSIIYASFLWI